MALSNAARERDSRFLSLFTVVRFPNSMCLTSSNSNGTCYTQQVRQGTDWGFYFVEMKSSPLAFSKRVESIGKKAKLLIGKRSSV